MTDPAVSASLGRSVYGLRVRGLDDPPEHDTTELDTTELDTTELDSTEIGAADLIPVLVRQSGQDAPADHELDADRHVAPLPDGRSLDLDRRAGCATFYGPRLPPDMLAHPYLGPVAVAFNRWAGREAFHAGAFGAAGRAWLVTGPSTAGKSTLMGALAAGGVPILADDVTVTDGDVVFAGPRSVDLRERYPDRVLSAAAPTIHRARAGTRWRIDLPAVPSRLPFGGWFFLHWDDQTSMTPVPMVDVLHRVAAIRSLRRLRSDPATILALSSRPAWDLRRPRDWAGLSGTVAAILETAQQASTLPAAAR